MNKYTFKHATSYLVLLAGSLALAGCTATEIDQFRQASTTISEDESIVILGRRHSNKYETENSFVDCVGDVVASGNNAINVVPEQEFLDAMFPFFEPRTAPMRVDNLQQLLNMETAAQKIDDYSIEYIVWLDGLTQRSGQTGGMTCTIGPTGAGCFGFGSWIDDSNFEAEIWDLDTLANAGSISTEANGQSYVPALIIPIPLLAKVEANACVGMGKQLKQFINGS